MSQSTAIWVSVLLLIGNAFFVGAEFAAMASRRSTLEPLAQAGSARARSVLGAMSQMGSMLATAQLGITVCSVGIGALAETALHDIFHHWFAGWVAADALASALALAVALAIVVYLHVVVGEMIPKNLALAGPDKAALVLVPPLAMIARVLRPVVRLMEGVAKAIVSAMGIEPKDELASAFTAEEVAHILRESHQEGLLEVERQDLAAAALEFSNKVAAEVAVPLEDLTCVGPDATPKDIEKLVARQGFSRFPVLAGDDLVGYLHLKDILYADDARYLQPVPAKRIRRLATVSPGDEIEEVLESMQQSGAHLARVVEADGRTTGVVFLEDVLEVLVGEVTDATQRDG